MEQNIYQRMHAAMKDIGTIKKDKKNTFQNYEYVSEEAIKTKCHKALVDHGIVFNLEVTEHNLEWLTGKNKQGQETTTGVSNAKFRYHFTNIDKPEERISGDFYAMSVDSSDKSFTKALTYAIREIMKSNFVISTGEPDPDSETPDVATAARTHTANATPESATFVQKKKIKELLGTKITAFETAKGVKVDDLTKTQASQLIDTLEAKQAKPTVQVEDEAMSLDEMPF